MKVYLVRHGADDDSIRGGWSNHPLTDEGLKQSEELAKKLKENNTCYCGSVGRAAHS